ncbi:hypothetical protein Br6_05030 [Rhodococcus sp. Br-6]|nr:hypothetical protein Br6_05030 [Rhodococcus sp. Br-6]
MDEQIADRAIRARLSDVQTEVKEWRCYTFNISDGPELVYTSTAGDDDEAFTVTELVISATRIDGRDWAIDWVNAQGPGSRNPVRARRLPCSHSVPDGFAWVRPYVDWVLDIEDDVPNPEDYPLIEARESVDAAILDNAVDLLLTTGLPPSLDEPDVRRMLGDALDTAVESGELIKLLDEVGVPRYPAFQFDSKNGQVIPIVACANRMTAHTDYPPALAPYARTAWWMTDQSVLGGHVAACEGLTTPLATLAEGALTEQIIGAAAAPRMGRRSPDRQKAWGEAVQRYMLAETPTYDAEEARRILGDTLDQHVEAGDLIVLRDQLGVDHYPAFQFDREQHRIRELVAWVNPQIMPREDPYGALTSWTTGHRVLDGRTLLDCLEAGDMTKMLVRNLFEDMRRGM